MGVSFSCYGVRLLNFNKSIIVVEGWNCLNVLVKSSNAWKGLVEFCHLLCSQCVSFHSIVSYINPSGHHIYSIDHLLNILPSKICQHIRWEAGQQYSNRQMEACEDWTMYSFISPLKLLVFTLLYCINTWPFLGKYLDFAYTLKL